MEDDEIMSARRRAAMFFLAAALVAMGAWILRPTADEAAAAPADPAAALAELRAGNRRFVVGVRTRSTDTSHDAERRRRTAKEQHPLATVLCCSDSRVCPEFIFDQSVGSLFEVRNAGNVVDDDVLASFEYAQEHLHVPLMLVLAHKGCGAIHAVCEAGDRPLHDHLKELQKHMAGIHDDVVRFRDVLDASVEDELSKKNARQQALALLQESPMLKEAVVRGAARLLYGVYDMDSGVVEFFEL
jgi:carbonic anhydrase